MHFLLKSFFLEIFEDQIFKTVVLSYINPNQSFCLFDLLNEGTCEYLSIFFFQVSPWRNRFYLQFFKIVILFCLCDAVFYG